MDQVSTPTHGDDGGSAIEVAFPNGDLLATDFEMGLSLIRYDVAGAQRWVNHLDDSIDGKELSSGVNHAVVTADGGVAFVTSTRGASSGENLPMLVRIAP